MRALTIHRAKKWLVSVLALLALLYLMGHMGGCKTALGVGYRSVLVVRNAGDATSKALAAACEAKRVACKAKHAIKTPGYRDCMKQCMDAFAAWRLYVKPTVNTSLRSAFGVLEVARAKKQKKAPWLEALKPGACQLLGILQEWKTFMPKDVASLLTLLKSVEGLVCK